MIKKTIINTSLAILLFISIPYIMLIRKNKKLIIFGTVPMINYKYWKFFINKTYLRQLHTDFKLPFILNCVF